jgi:uncharacterized spore protein YtfJ
MNTHEMLQSLSDKLATSASVKNVYGEPVTVGNRTIIPVACVRYGFGAGGGEKRGEQESHGGGGGGGMFAKPAGVLEITPEGTRFIPFPDYRKIAAAVAAGLILGLIVGRSRRKRVP